MNIVDCLACRKHFSSTRALTIHIVESHHVSVQSYYDQFLKSREEGFCEECDKPTKFWYLTNGYARFCSRSCRSKSPAVRNKRSVSLTGKTGWWRGRRQSIESNRKRSETQKGQPSPLRGRVSPKKGQPSPLRGRPKSEKTRKRMRLAFLRRLEKQHGRTLHPFVGLLEGRILDAIEQKFRFRIQRQYSIIGYFLDGLIPELNLAIEIDEESSHRGLESRDLRRQREIEKELGCSFFRISDSSWLRESDCILLSLQHRISSFDQSKGKPNSISV